MWACLLLLLPPAAAAAPTPPAAAPPSPALLILRAACAAADPAAFSSVRLQEYAAAAGRPPPPPNYRLLSYKETCGENWRSTVNGAVLRSLAGGGGAVTAGWAGDAVCGLAAAARLPQPASCAAPAARAALAVRLANRLHWRRVSLHGDAAGPCAAAMRAIRDALLVAGLVVQHAKFYTDELTDPPHVIITCGSLPRLWSFAPQLLLNVGESDLASPISNITLDVRRSPYIRNVTVPDVVNMSIFSSSFRIPIMSPVNDDDNGAEPPRLLLRKTLLGSSASDLVHDAYDDILDGIERDTHTRQTGVQTVHDTYYLYEEQTPDSPQLLAAFNTMATWRLEGDEDWHVTVEEVNATDAWERWRPPDEPGATAAVLWAALGAVLVLLVLGAAVGARGAALRRQGRRRRRDVVLAAADFTFPADELRRVPDGMETMLSCWLQQLHEFGGPELERPDLLKQPAPPSAPSSNASGSRLALDRRTRYKGDAVHLKLLPPSPTAPTLELRRKATDVLLVLHNLRHENLNPFIGCLCESRPSLVFDHCGRGSLEDVLMADDIKLDWTFRLSLLTDLVKGLRYLHGSALRVHGRLSSRNCVVDSRWVLRLTDYGLAELLHAQGFTAPPRRARELLWTAPELLRAGAGARGTQPGDVFSFAIVMQEVIVRGEPYCMLALSPEEIIEKLCRPPPLIRPSVSMGAAPPEAVSVMRQCWAEAPELRPDTNALLDIFRLLHRGRKINIVDSMFEMLEKYSNNLEELIKERTEQLDMEKKKTEQLLNRMLPRYVAERLVMGQSVEPEEFEEVSIYFSDIVGFTGIAARSSPVQVVALLNDLYTTFDAAIERYKVYKVETIGDAYMVVGGLPVRARDHAESVATMALHLLHLAGRFRIRHLPAAPLHLRIGLHSGPCCAGVVGLTMPRYCLFGDTVNTASRMESTGAAWRIQISAATAARLEAAGGYRLRSRGLTQIKGKGVMHTYWLLGKDGFDKPLPTPPPLPAEEALLEHEAETDLESGDTTPPASEPRGVSRDDAALLAHDRFAWQRSGAVSADSSPPAAPYSRYRCRGGARALRRQWSLERGEALAAARAGSPPPRAVSAEERRPLALSSAAPRIPRYRTRPDRDANVAVSASASFD